MFLYVSDALTAASHHAGAVREQRTRPRFPLYTQHTMPDDCEVQSDSRRSHAAQILVRNWLKPHSVRPASLTMYEHAI